MSTPVVAFAGMTHLGLVSGVGTASKGLHGARLRPRCRADRALARGQIAGARARSRRHAAGERRSRRASRPTLPTCGKCDVVYIAPDVPTDDTGQQRSGRHPRADRRGGRRISAQTRSWSSCARCRRASRALCHSRPSGSTIRWRRWYSAARWSAPPSRSASSSAAPIPSSRCPNAYRTVLEAFGCPILPMRYESAELAKISINMCLVASIGVANTMAELCEDARRRLERDRPGAEARPAHRTVQLSGAGPRHRRRQPRARSWRPCIRLGRASTTPTAASCGVARQQPPLPRLGAAHAARAPCSTTSQTPLDRRVGARLQREHPLDEELAVAGHAAADCPTCALRLHDPAVPASSRGACRARSRRPMPYRGAARRRCPDDPDAVAAVPRHRARPTSPQHCAGGS